MVKRSMTRGVAAATGMLLLGVGAVSAQVRLQQPPRPGVRVPTSIVRTVTVDPALRTVSGVASVTLNPDAVYAGQSSTITVQLLAAAEAGGAKVLLTGSPAALGTVPASISIAAGQTTGTFEVVTAAGGSGALQIGAGVEGMPGKFTTSLQVVAPAAAPAGVDSLKVPAVVNAWSNATGTVVLSRVVEGSDATVTLTRGDGSVLSAPATVVVPVGQRSQTFQVTGASFGANGTSSLTATLNATSKVSQVRVNPGNTITSYADLPRYIKAGSSVTFTVKVSGVAPAGGVAVPIYVKNTTEAVLPPTVTIPAGQSAGTVTFNAGQKGGAILLYRTQSELQSYTGSCGNQNDPCAAAQVTLQPSLSQAVFRVNYTTEKPAGATVCYGSPNYCTFNALTVEGGAGVLLVVSTNPYPDPMVISFSASHPQAVTLPPNITFQGNYWYNHNVSMGTRAVTSPTDVTITVSCAGCKEPATRTLTLTVTPGIAVSALTVPATDIKGGTTANGTVTLSKPAPAGGTKIDFTSSNGSICGVPASITVPAGQTSAAFLISTQAVPAIANVTLSASVAGGAAKTLSVRVTP